MVNLLTRDILSGHTVSSAQTDFDGVLRAEFSEIFGQELPAGQDAVAALEASGIDTSALCLSGGGIRSATFALGVLQTFARFGLLSRFSYLSTVSGGGYTGSWLSGWRAQQPDETVFPALNQSLQTGTEPQEIDGLRKDSNYITPQLGLLSADTWTVATLYVRNLLLNWILFVPFFLGCFMIPRLCRSILNYLAQPLQDTVWNRHAYALFWSARTLGATLVIIGLGFSIYGRFRRADGWLTNARFQCLVLLPLVLSAALFTAGAVIIGGADQAAFSRYFEQHHLGVGAGWGAFIYFASWGIGRLASHKQARAEERRIDWSDVVVWTLSGVVVGMLAALGMYEIATQLHSAPVSVVTRLAVVIGTSGFVVAYLAGELFYVGLASFSPRGDMDREWLARSSGWLGATAFGWALFSAIVLYLPLIPLKLDWKHLVLGAVGGTSGLVTMVLGGSAMTAATRAAQTLKSVPLMRLASAAAIIFALVAADLIAHLDWQLEHVLIGLQVSPVLADVFWLLALLLFSAELSRFINVNRFSMHALYRNRLVRAFLGSARADERDPDPFTGFDPLDNIELAASRPKSGGSSLFHVINTTLNVVSGRNRAWQERKAEPFTMTRLHCGSGKPDVGYRPTRSYGGGRTAGGIRLGTAMAISGAAVSPNQGYNSSPLVGFLLMLFNVRLGWWLGNPAQSTYWREGPEFSLAPGLRELAGATNDESKWIYLSDGGHFENLGLYEMIRRRCRIIVVSDAGCDPHCTFEDLGNAVRKIFIDFGVSINFDKLEIKARQTPPAPGVRFAIGTITYPGSKRTGWLLYLKPTFQGTERADIRSYAAGSPTFPHESTTDQWFSESQLESYRALGASIAEFICTGGRNLDPGQRPSAMSLEALKIIASELLIEESGKYQAKPACCSRDSA